MLQHVFGVVGARLLALVVIASIMIPTVAAGGPLSLGDGPELGPPVEGNHAPNTGQARRDAEEALEFFDGYEQLVEDAEEQVWLMKRQAWRAATCWVHHGPLDCMTS